MISRFVSRPRSASVSVQRIAVNALRRQSASDTAAIADGIAAAVGDIDAQLAAIDGRVNDLENPPP